MKPKTIDDILVELHLRPSQIARGKQQLIELFMSCVPDCIEKEQYDGREESFYMGGWNDCRNEMIKNLEKLK